MDVRAVPLQGYSRKQDGFFKGRPTLYIVILLGAFIASSIYHFRVDDIFACAAGGYTSDRYLAHCDAANYGDYEHGAYWFDLEPAAERAAASADVLFLGDSRVQFAFSTPATAQWFSSASIGYHLLGFVAFENSIFARALLHRLKPRAKVYVIPVTDFFQQSAAPEAKHIMQDDAARSRYAVKRRWQFIHEAVCMKLTTVCGHAFAVFRSRQTGMWSTSPLSMKSHGSPASYNEQIDEHKIDEAIAIGRIFLSELPVKPECVLLTVIPTVGTKLGAANAIASGLGKTLVVPQNLDGLQTFDGTHLDHASAERWSEAFFKIAGPQIQRCLEVTKHGGSAATSPS
jgi:hypothetical protein